MTAISDFRGFPRQCVDFYTELTQNNSKTWFDTHKNDFEKYVLGPLGFCVRNGQISGKNLSENQRRSPREPIDLSSVPGHPLQQGQNPIQDPSWDFLLGRFTCQNGVFRILLSSEPPTLFLAAGIHCFSPLLLSTYRDSVVDPKHGADLIKAIKQVSKLKGYSVGGTHYKKTPRGYDANNENAAMLLYNGLYVWTEDEIPSEFYSAQILDYCIDRFKKMSPLHKWLVDMTARAGT